jgi:hypothetical protein
MGKQEPTPSPEDIEAMRETLIAMGAKSETYYRKCTDAQVMEEYDRMGA